MPSRLALALIAGMLSAGPVPAAEKKPAQLRDFPFWSAPKQPHARDFVPGLRAALQLTPDQVAKIEAACRETIDKPEAKGKNAPGAAAAREQLEKQVADILTADQKKLIEKINDAYGKALSEAADEFQPQIESAKGNAEETAKLRALQREATVAAFEKRLDQVLSADQREAVKKAGEEVKKREEEAKKTPKPGK